MSAARGGRRPAAGPRLRRARRAGSRYRRQRRRAPDGSRASALAAARPPRPAPARQWRRARRRRAGRDWRRRARRPAPTSANRPPRRRRSRRPGPAPAGCRASGGGRERPVSHTAPSPRPRSRRRHRPLPRRGRRDRRYSSHIRSLGRGDRPRGPPPSAPQGAAPGMVSTAAVVAAETGSSSASLTFHGPVSPTTSATTPSPAAATAGRADTTTAAAEARSGGTGGPATPAGSGAGPLREPPGSHAPPTPDPGSGPAAPPPTTAGNEYAEENTLVDALRDGIARKDTLAIQLQREAIESRVHVTAAVTSRGVTTGIGEVSEHIRMLADGVRKTAPKAGGELLAPAEDIAGAPMSGATLDGEADKHPIEHGIGACREMGREHEGVALVERDHQTGADGRTPAAVVLDEEIVLRRVEVDCVVEREEGTNAHHGAEGR